MIPSLALAFILVLVPDTNPDRSAVFRRVTHGTDLRRRSRDRSRTTRYWHSAEIDPSPAAERLSSACATPQWTHGTAMYSTGRGE
ncbi:hypothetical protein [Natrialba taiwanensis]|nr:hypothetical protein [Natrialba taiwanensis]